MQWLRRPSIEYDMPISEIGIFSAYNVAWRAKMQQVTAEVLSRWLEPLTAISFRN